MSSCWLIVGSGVKGKVVLQVLQRTVVVVMVSSLLCGTLNLRFVVHPGQSARESDDVCITSNEENTENTESIFNSNTQPPTVRI